MTKVKHYLLLLPIILLALAMTFAGAGKLAGLPELHQSFAMLGLPSWFGYFIGAAELAAGIGLLIPRLTALAATGLIPIMIGAAYFHIAFNVPSAAPAIIFVVLSVYAVFYRKEQAVWYPV